MSNKSIILTETELKAIIKDTVNETLNSYQKNLMNDFRQIFHPASFDNPLTYLMRKPIEEGITKTYPIDITIRYINDYFNKYHLNVFIRKGSTLTKDEKIIIEFPNTNDNFNIINKALYLCGYYLGFPKEDEIVKNKNLWLTLEYEPRHQSDDTQQIKEEEIALVHITPNYYLEKIKRQGFVPRARNNVFNYPDRIYFLRASLPDMTILNMARRLIVTNDNLTHDYVYNFIWIDLSKISDDVKFYFDPNAENSIYTTDNIKPNSICDIQEFNFKTENKR